MTTKAKPLSITLDALLALGPCDAESRSTQFGRRKTMTAAQALKAGASVRDILWVAARMGRKDLCVRFALACARRVAHLSKDPRTQAALDAAQTWLGDPSEENRTAARRAYADAADAAATYAAAYVEARQKEQKAQEVLLVEIMVEG